MGQCVVIISNILHIYIFIFISKKKWVHIKQHTDMAVNLGYQSLEMSGNMA